MMTFRRIWLISLFSLISCSGWAQLFYEKGGATFELYEEGPAYVVRCRVRGSNSGSRDYSFAVSRSRLTAKNIIGAGILFKTFAKANKLDDSYFRIFVDCAAVNYRAEIVGFVQKRVSESDEIIYECPKENYLIKEASYRKISDIGELLQMYYDLRKDGYSASRLYSYDKVSIANSLSFYNDYLSGNAQVSETYSRLQSYNNRLDESVYSDSNQMLDNLVADASASMEKENPFRSCCLIELVTTAAIKDKNKYYEKWITTLSRDILAENILLFCSKECSLPLPEENILATDMVMAYPGALSPFAFRKGSDYDYSRAAALYSSLRFDEAVLVLEESINMNGVTDKNLCLLGASLRLAGKPEKALPYLIMCAYLNPKTEFLAGNIVMCLSELKFKNLDSVLKEVQDLDVDPWSRKQVESLIKQ